MSNFAEEMHTKLGVYEILVNFILCSVRCDLFPLQGYLDKGQ